MEGKVLNSFRRPPLNKTDDKLKDKFDCLYNTWKNNELVEPCIKITYDKHNDKRAHHKINWNLLSKNLNNKKLITPINRGIELLTYQDFGIEVVECC